MSLRAAPSGYQQDQMIRDQENRCIYCGLEFGSLVSKKGQPVVLKLHWDHFVPYSVLRANPHDNWVGACHICNGIKRNHQFQTLDAARRFISQRRKRLLEGDPSETPPSIPGVYPARFVPRNPVEKHLLAISRQFKKVEQRLLKEGASGTAWFELGRLSSELAHFAETFPEDDPRVPALLLIARKMAEVPKQLDRQQEASAWADLGSLGPRFDSLLWKCQE